MTKSLTPSAYAFRINRTIQAAFPVGTSIPAEHIVKEFAPVFAPGVPLELRYEPLDHLEGAMIPSTSGQSFTILVNSAIEAESRRNFTIAHEFGHFLCHRELGREFRCEPRAMDRFEDSSSRDYEVEANEFASQLLLPNNVVRDVADAPGFNFEAVAKLADRTGSSLPAAALACVRLSRRAIGFAVTIDGFVKWGRASDRAYSSGLFFKSGQEAPSGSISAFEAGGPSRPLEPRQNVEDWRDGVTVNETGFFSGRYGEAYVFFELG